MIKEFFVFHIIYNLMTYNMAMIDPMKSMNSTNSLDTLKTTSDISRVYETSINAHDARLRS